MPVGSYIKTKEHRIKLGLSHIGKSSGMLGKKHSLATKQHLSEVHKLIKNTWNTKYKKGKKLTPEHIAKIKESNSGEKNYHWYKDRTKLKKSERKDKDVQYIYWSREIKNRDNWKCRLLNSDCEGRLESHHILDWENNPELRYLLENGITLCHAHHPRGRAEEKRMIPIFQELLSVSEN